MKTNSIYLRLTKLRHSKHGSIDFPALIITSNANIGGPTTAAAMAVSKGWGALIVPGLLVGTLGYVLGNYLGILSGIALH